VKVIKLKEVDPISGLNKIFMDLNYKSSWFWFWS